MTTAKNDFLHHKVIKTRTFSVEFELESSSMQSKLVGLFKPQIPYLLNGGNNRV